MLKWCADYICALLVTMPLFTSHQVAIKILNPTSPQAIRNFETEIACMSKLDHPYVAKIYDVIYETIDEHGFVHHLPHAEDPHKVYPLHHYSGIEPF